MQVTQADDKKFRRAGVEQDSFRGMKKFLMSRSDQKEAVVSEPPPVAEKVPVKETKAVVVQPPLPPYPPPDSPPDLNIKIKQEKQDEEEEETKQINIVEKPNQHQKPKVPKKTICKEFIRGDCRRALCKFAHEVDTSQLKGVFTFCWDYQNAVCTFKNCRYVHATIFEEGEFYRTGILPPHVRQHMKPQAPPTEVAAGIITEAQPASVTVSDFTNPPPFHPGVEKPPIISCVPTSIMEARPEDTFRTAQPRSISPLKREWRELEEFSSSPRDLEQNGNDHMVKKCKNCDFVEFSVKYYKEMVESAKQKTEETNKKIGLLNKKNNKLLHVLMLLKPVVLNKSSLSLQDDKEKSMLEQLNDFVGSNTRTPIISDENLLNIMGNNINSLMAKLLCGSGEQVLSADASRDN